MRLNQVTLGGRWKPTLAKVVHPYVSYRQGTKILHTRISMFTSKMHFCCLKLKLAATNALWHSRDTHSLFLGRRQRNQQQYKESIRWNNRHKAVSLLGHFLPGRQSSEKNTHCTQKL